MDESNTLAGYFVWDLSVLFLLLVPFVVMGALSYFLGKRKTQQPKLAAFIGVMLTFALPLGVLYLVLLLLKDDLECQTNHQSLQAGN